MNAQQARKIFDAMISETKDAEQRAKVELLREILCNAEFRNAFSDHVWKINSK
jgi:hypothetical protein